LYKRIWTDEGSPLLVYTKKQTELVRKSLQMLHPSIEVEYGMRYGTPSLESAIDKLIAAGCSKILLFNMYPHYSSTTVATNYDVVFKHLLKRRVVPTLRVAEPYFAHPEYIEALATTINEAYANMDPKPEKLVLSYHGIPEEYVQKGDTYCCHCAETTKAMVPKLHIPAEHVIHTYQSRFGKDPWLVPYSDETIRELGEKGVKHIAVACPGFTSDCLETLDEMGHEGLEEFQESGGETLQLVPCLNDHPAWIEGMTKLIRKELGSWLETAERTGQQACKVACPVLLAKQAASGT
ncbi:MAG: ferrochelatase, partial [Bdellovibrionales bacterium]|nr:ferrochelatase [Bdellovibrionales bacterium]